MVSISITPVTRNAARPIAVSRPALRENEPNSSGIALTPGASGSTFSRMKSCSASTASSNAGNAVATASAAVSRGTSASSVV